MRVIITGATGMVGKGVLLECLDDPRVTDVLLISRKSVGVVHAKIEELRHADFAEFESVRERLAGYDACFHCMGISSAGVDEATYTALTYGVSEALARVLYAVNPEMVVVYVSGEGTDETERGRRMWARVKGRTENMILGMGFRDAYAFRPGVILPERGVRSKTPLYNVAYGVLRPLFPLLRRMDRVTTTSALGRAMINVVERPRAGKRLAGAEIGGLAGGA